jgi:hypothetical protein
MPSGTREKLRRKKPSAQVKWGDTAWVKLYTLGLSPIFPVEGAWGNKNLHFTHFWRVMTSARYARVKGLEMVAVSCFRTTFLQG